MHRLSLYRLGRHQHGSVLMVVGLSFLFLVAIGGAAYDLGHQQMVRMKMQQASDAAALAGAALTPATDDERRTEANRYFQMNYPASYLGVARPYPTIEVTSEYVKVSANSDLRTNFVVNIGVHRLPVKGLSKTLIQKKPPIDMILAMDNSASMARMDIGSGPVADVRSGLYSATRTATINRCVDYYITQFGIARATAVSGCNVQFPDGPGYPSFGLFGRNRIGALRASAENIVAKILNIPVHDNRMAVIRWDETLIASVPFSNSYTQVSNLVNGMGVIGGTNSTVGLSAANSRLNDARSEAVQAVVLLTDGVNQQYTTANPASLAICRQIKNKGVLLYTIAYSAELTNPTNTTIAYPFLSECASGAKNQNQNLYFFIAPDAATLEDTFQRILESLQKVRIVE